MYAMLPEMWTKNQYLVSIVSSLQWCVGVSILFLFFLMCFLLFKMFSCCHCHISLLRYYFFYSVLLVSLILFYFIIVIFIKTIVMNTVTDIRVLIYVISFQSALAIYNEDMEQNFNLLSIIQNHLRVTY